MSFDFIATVTEKLYDWAVTELPIIVLIIVITFFVLRIYKYLVKRIKKMILNRLEKKEELKIQELEKRVDTLMSILHSTGKVVIWVISIMIVLKKIGIDIGPILAGAGILGLAVGFGAQELVRDFISGFFILLENQIRAGDVAIINSTGGLVESIELRTTTLRDFTGTTHVFQNGKINTISNMTKEWSAVTFDIGVAYKEDVERVMEIMKQVGDELYGDIEFKEKMIEPLEVFGIDNFADSAVIIKARIKTQPIQQWGVGREYRKRLKKAFDREGIEIPFPHTTVYWGEKINPLRLELEKELKGKHN